VPTRLTPALLLSLVALSGAACGGDSDDPATAPGPDVAGADPEDVEVIDAWASALAGGDVEAAAEFFALPSIAENGLTARIATREDARQFNASLPCGGELVAAETQGDFTTATFELTERPGPGRCGEGTGNEAQTAFVIEGGEIVEWRRVGLPELEETPGDAV
jgi:hypothetical protein